MSDSECGIGQLPEKENDMKCHWSLYCNRDGTHYVTAHIEDKPYSVWTCERCRTNRGSSDE